MPTLLRRRLPALVGLLAVLGSGCPGGDAPAPQGGPTGASPSPTVGATADRQIFYGFLREPSSIDPARALDPDDLNVVEQVFDSLTAIDADLEAVPAAAERWETNRGGPDDGASPAEVSDAEDEADRPPGSVWTFHLQPAAQFHDGRPVDAVAFKRAWERILQTPGGEAPSAALFLLEIVEGFEEARSGGELTGVEVVDRRTLRVTLTQSFADFPALVSHPALGPVPPAAIEDSEAFGEQPVGNGPFRLAEPWQPGQLVRLQAFDDHYGGTPALDEVVYRIYSGPNAVATAYQDFLDGNLDVAPVPPQSREEAVERFGSSPDGYEGPGVVAGLRTVSAFYGFDTTRPPFDDPAVRQAISLLIDRETIAEQVVGEGQTAAAEVVPPVFPAYRSPECDFCRFDPEHAQRLLEDRELGTIELVYFEEPEHNRVARRVQRDVDAALGDGSLQLRPLPQDAWLEVIRNGAAGFFLTGWVAEYPAVDAVLYPLFHRGRRGTDNLTAYDNAEVSALLADDRAELDADARRDLYRRVEGQVLADMPVAPLYHYRHARVVADRVEGYRIGPLGRVDLAAVRMNGEG